MPLHTFCATYGFDVAELRTSGSGAAGSVVIESYFNERNAVNRDHLKLLTDRSLALCQAASATSGQLLWHTEAATAATSSNLPVVATIQEIKTSACIHVKADGTFLVMYSFDRLDPLPGSAAAAAEAATAALRGTVPTATRHLRFSDVSPVASGVYTVDISTSGLDAPKPAAVTPAVTASMSFRRETFDSDFDFHDAHGDDEGSDDGVFHAGGSDDDNDTTMAVFGDKNADVASRGRGKRTLKKAVPKLALPQLINGCDVQAALTARSRRPDFMTTMCIMEMLDMSRVRVGPNSQVFKASYRGTPVVIKSVHPGKQSDASVLDEFAFEGAWLVSLLFGTLYFVFLTCPRRPHIPCCRDPAEALCRVDHPNICLALGCGGDPLPFIVLEQLQPLHKFLNMKGIDDRPFPLERVLSMARDLASGLHYLHELMFDDAMVIHRDIKLENVGLDDKGRLKLFDFGLGRCVKKRTSENQAYKMTGETGTLRYMAPEIVLNEAYTEKVDVYSFAITVWSMASNLVAFKNVKQEQFHGTVAVGGLRPPMDPLWPGMFKDLLEACWHADSKRRPSCAAILTSLQRMMPRPPSSQPRSSAHNPRRTSRPQVPVPTHPAEPSAQETAAVSAVMHISSSVKVASFALPPIATGQTTIIPSLAGSRWTSSKY